MASEFFEGRVQLLHDTEEHWQSVANTFIPLPGEACVTLDEENKGRVKYGDGLHTWGELNYSNDGSYDGKSIVSLNHVIQLVGYKEADEGKVPQKSEDGLTWVNTVRSVKLGNDEPLLPTDDGSIHIESIPEEVLGGTLTPVAFSNVDNKTLEISEKVISVKQVDASAITYNEEKLNETLDEIKEDLTWKNF